MSEAACQLGASKCRLFSFPEFRYFKSISSSLFKKVGKVQLGLIRVGVEYYAQKIPGNGKKKSAFEPDLNGFQSGLVQSLLGEKMQKTKDKRVERN